MTKKFKHSGALGDLIYSLPIVKHFGGGEFYLHLNQIDWIGQYYYGGHPSQFHQGRMTAQDFDYMKSFMESQDYITKFDVLSPQVEITHNLDRFRVPFVGHPGNYVDIYSSVFGLTAEQATHVRTTPWLTAQPVKIPGRTVVVNRTERWCPPTLSAEWSKWQAAGIEDQAVFVGLPNEYEKFKKDLGWNIPYQETPSMKDLAEVIAGAEAFIGNQSQCLALAIGLGKKYACEYRRDLPIERNECYFPLQPGGTYF